MASRPPFRSRLERRSCRKTSSHGEGCSSKRLIAESFHAGTPVTVIDNRVLAISIHKMNLNSPAPRRSPRLRARLREATEREILQAAETTLAAQGLDRLNMNDVAAKAGVAVGTIYNYFRDRDALVGALFRERRAAFAKALADAAGACAGSPFASQLTCFVRAVFAEFDAHSASFRSSFESEAWRKHAPAGGGRGARRVMRQMEDRARELAERGVAEGALRPDRAELHGTVLFGVIHGLLAQRLRGLATMPIDDLVGLAVDVFLGGAGFPR